MAETAYNLPVREIEMHEVLMMILRLVYLFEQCSIYGCAVKTFLFST